MNAAHRITDADHLGDIDQKLDAAPELRVMLRETSVGQEILALVRDAQQVLAARDVSRAAARIVGTTPDIAIEQVEDREACAGAIRVHLNGVKLWEMTFALGHAESQQHAIEGGRLYAETLRRAVGGVS